MLAAPTCICRVESEVVSGSWVNASFVYLQPNAVVHIRELKPALDVGINCVQETVQLVDGLVYVSYIFLIRVSLEPLGSTPHCI